jgi:hypothetical protein
MYAYCLHCSRYIYTCIPLSIEPLYIYIYMDTAYVIAVIYMHTACDIAVIYIHTACDIAVTHICILLALQPLCVYICICILLAL